MKTELFGILINSIVYFIILGNNNISNSFSFTETSLPLLDAYVSFREVQDYPKYPFNANSVASEEKWNIGLGGNQGQEGSFPPPAATR